MTDQRDRRDGELRVGVALPLPAPSLPAKRQKLLVWEVICLPRERPNSSTSSDGCLCLKVSLRRLSWDRAGGGRDMWVSRFLFSTLYSRRTQFSRAEDAFGGCTTRSTTSPSSEMMKRGDDTAPAACTYLDPVPCLLGPPPMNTPVREGETIEGGVPYHAESTLSSAQVLNAVKREREKLVF